jgi:peptide/nickel transport system permease protein
MTATTRTGGTADHAVTDAPWFLADRRAAFGLSVYLLLVLLAMFAPVVSTGDPAVQRDVVATRFLPPLSTDLHGVFHLVGTDRFGFGRDVWTRLVYGSRISLSVGILAMVVSVTIGVFVGAMAGLWRGAVRATLLGLTDFALALPRVVLLLLLAALWQPSALLVVVVLGVTGWMPITRLVYGEVRGLSARPFVHAAEALGVRRSAILSRHVLPNAMTPVIVAATLGVGNAIMLEAGLSFLGVGVQPPMPSWGNMIASGRDTLVNAPWVATAPGLLLVLVVVASTLLGSNHRSAPSDKDTGC